MKSLNLNNIKCHFILKEELCPGRRRGSHLKFPKSCILTVYKHSKNILHFTGIRNINSLNALKKLIFCLYNVVLFKIDSLMFSRKRFDNFDIKKLLFHVQSEYSQKYFIYYDDELLSGSKGIYLKPKNASLGCSLIIFRTASATAMGGGSICGDVKKCQKILEDLLENIYKCEYKKQ